MGKLILSLCDRSGVWSAPYLEADYRVIRVDLHEGKDVRLLQHLGQPVHGILAAPPCTHFSKAGAAHWPRKGDAAVLDGLSVVDACLRVVAVHRPNWWALENPPGRLTRWLGPPVFKFQPWEFGDPWTKLTYLWGVFTPPTQLGSSTKAVVPDMGDVTTKLGSGDFRRSLTPPGFARAFFEANQ